MSESLLTFRFELNLEKKTSLVILKKYIYFIILILFISFFSFLLMKVQIELLIFLYKVLQPFVKTLTKFILLEYFVI